MSVVQWTLTVRGARRVGEGVCNVQGRAQQGVWSGTTQWRRRSLCLARLGHRRALFGLAASFLPRGGAVFHLCFDIVAVLRRFSLAAGAAAAAAAGAAAASADHMAGRRSEPVLRPNQNQTHGEVMLKECEVARV